MKKGISRRKFFRRSASSVAATAIFHSSIKAEKLIPYITPPEEIRPGTWALYATTCRECPAGCGIHLRHRDGRVVKAEGNPIHPLNKGGLCARGQSCLQGLYDPDRLMRPLKKNDGSSHAPAGWDEALDSIGSLLKESGRRLVIISSLQTGALGEIIEKFAGTFGLESVTWFEPVNYESQTIAHEMLFGQAAIPEYRLDGVDFVFSLAADFLDTWLSPVQFTNRFSESHSYRDGRIGSLVYAGPAQSLTSASADSFIRTTPGSEWKLGAAVLNAMLENDWAGPEKKAVAEIVESLGWQDIKAPAGVEAESIERWAKELFEGESTVALGGAACTDSPSAAKAAAAAALINVAAGNIGKTVNFSRSWSIGRAAGHSAVSSTIGGLDRETMLITIDSNPAYSLPGAGESLAGAGIHVHLGTHLDETAESADWVLPIDSFLESWGDFEPADGIHNLVQPVMQRIHDTHTAGDVLLELARTAGKPLARTSGETPADTYEWLRSRWREIFGGGETFEEMWKNTLRKGFFESPVEGKAEPQVALQDNSKAGILRSPAAVPDGGIRLWIRPSMFFYDGRTANRGWLQEAPDPLSTLAWGSCADIHPETAESLGIEDGDSVSISNSAGSLITSARLTKDIVPESVLLTLGQGHTSLGSIAKGIGINAFGLLEPGNASENPFGTVTVEAAVGAPDPVYLSATQDQHGREILQWEDLEELRGKKPGEGDKISLPLPEGYDPHHDIYKPHPHKGHRWAMAIDLQRCTGCGACAVACYAENNVAVMGRKRASEGREMAWLKIVPYRHPEDESRVAWLPMLCQHCDAAPCEPVCPVFAAVHSEEGLNQQVYNRCIGTRYCSNNCPYKVRRFNWFDTWRQEPLDLQLNPDVTVRSRGVMEKCTFCVQRIKGSELDAKREGRPVRDGEIQPACVESCPAGAMVFGDLMDPESRVTKITRMDPRRYHVLGGLNTKPAVTYLRRITNNKA